MTRKQWAKLTPEEQRIKVAELCGFTDIHEAFTDSKLIGLPRHDSPGGPWGLGNYPIPDYLNDLNAMHEVEEHVVGPVLTKSGRWPEYLANLRCVCHWDKYEDRCNAIPEHATAAQRAEAFVLTMTE